MSIIACLGIVILLLIAVFYFKINKELSNKNREIEQQRKSIEKHRNKILESINYAKRIQQTILPENTLMEKFFSKFFAVYRPKDIVGGDFYWYRCFGDIAVVATVDCTGHGVPGGFMSMMGSLLMDRIIQKNKLDTSLILSELNKDEALDILTPFKR